MSGPKGRRAEGRRASRTAAGLLRWSLYILHPAHLTFSKFIFPPSGAGKRAAANTSCFAAARIRSKPLTPTWQHPHGTGRLRDRRRRRRRLAGAQRASDEAGGDITSRRGQDSMPPRSHRSLSVAPSTAQKQFFLSNELRCSAKAAGGEGEWGGLVSGGCAKRKKTNKKNKKVKKLKSYLSVQNKDGIVRHEVNPPPPPANKPVINRGRIMQIV